MISPNNEDECVGDFYRLLATNGFMSTLHSNGITYEEFRNGYYVAGFDLTTSQEGAGDPLSIPSVRLGTAWYNKVFTTITLIGYRAKNISFIIFHFRLLASQTQF